LSYAIVKSITVKDGKVFVRSADNNVWPRDYDARECPSLTKVYEAGGREALDVDILASYEEGNFQPGTQNKYTRALKVLRHMPEYQAFNWRHSTYKPDDPIEINRKGPGYQAILKRALETPLPSDKFIIRRDREYRGYTGSDGWHYLRKRGKASAVWERDINKATAFNYKADAESYRGCFAYSRDWEIINLSDPAPARIVEESTGQLALAIE